MTFTNLLAELDKLNHTEKLQAIQYLAHSLETEKPVENAEPRVDHIVEVWSPQDEGGAVAALHELLSEYEQAQHGK